MKKVILQFTHDTLISDVQDSFHRAYPHLKISFFTHPHAICKSNSRNQEIPAHTKIGDVSGFKTQGSFELVPGMLVTEFEQRLWADFGLSAQVLRDAGHHYVQTTTTDGWSMDRQELHGESSHAMYEHLNEKEKV